MARKKNKTGRRANSKERKIAREWVELYRQASKEPNGLLCLNPNDEPELRDWLDAKDPTHLLDMLENFSKNGTFQQVGPLYESINLLPIRMQFKRLRSEGKTYQESIAILAEEERVDSRTIERWLSTDKS